MNIKSALQASIFIVVVSLIVSACNNPSASMSTPSEIATTPLPHSMKGYELYSWQVNNQWHELSVILWYTYERVCQVLMIITKHKLFVRGENITNMA